MPFESYTPKGVESNSMHKMAGKLKLLGLESFNSC